MVTKHKLLISKTREFEGENHRKSMKLMLSALSIMIGLYLCSLLIPFLLIKIISSILHGLLIVRLFGMYHDYVHGAILRKGKLGGLILKAFGLYALTPISVWRRSHNFHHAHNSKLEFASIGSFPIMAKQEFLNASKLEQQKYLLARHPVVIVFGYLTIFLFGMAVRPALLNFKEHKDTLLALGIHVLSGFLHWYFGGWLILIFAFFIPHLISSGVGSYLFYAQHNFPEAIFKNKKEWSYIDAALYSSSYMKMSSVWEWFTANIGYHHIHHVNSKIPFYRLPEVMASIDEFKNPPTTSLSVKGIQDCLKLKLWDEQTGHLIPK